MNMTYSERRQWFIERIGKVIYRTKTDCRCRSCEQVYENGILIEDEFHAECLHDWENEYGGMLVTCRYFDTTVERDEYETKLKSKA